MLAKRVDDGFTWGATKDSALITYLEESDDSKYRQVWEHLKYHEETDEDEVNKMVREDDHVFLEWRSHLDLRMKEQHKLTSRCDYAVAKEDFFIERAALAFAKNMQWIDRFNDQ